MTIEAFMLWGAMPALAASAVCATIRLLKGPSLADRAVAVDLLGAICIGFVAAFALAVDEPMLVDVALAIALIGFLGTVAFARYIERGA
ncbi:MAG: monovalent cation/H+ antiporter complex subunit F [Vicinamibacterales bacterium]|nr:monovalent cation/H+ antiporter complex subunit F [Vicinamibacterales bacterium]